MVSTPSQQPPPPTRALSATTPYILAAGALGIVAMLGLSHRSAVRSERAMGAITSAQKLLLAHAGLRARVGPIVASGSFSMECTDTAAKGWFRTAVMGGDAPPAGRAYMQASRPSGGLAAALGWGGERPWALQALRLEVDLAGLEARAEARRAVAVKAGYAADASSGSGSGSGGSEGGSPVRQALLELGGEPMEGGLIGFEVVREEGQRSEA